VFYPLYSVMLLYLEQQIIPCRFLHLFARWSCAAVLVSFMANIKKRKRPTCNSQVGLVRVELFHCTCDHVQRSRRQQIRLSSSWGELATSRKARHRTFGITPTSFAAEIQVRSEFFSKSEQNNNCVKKCTCTLPVRCTLCTLSEYVAL